MFPALLAAAGGAGVGLFAGFIAAVLNLRLKRWRNDRRMARGYPGIRDCVLSPFHLPGAAIGALAGAALSLAFGPVWASVLGGSALPQLVLARGPAGHVDRLWETVGECCRRPLHLQVAQAERQERGGRDIVVRPGGGPRSGPG